MISIRLMGGLANQLFQISHVFSFAKKHSVDYGIPTEVINPHIPGGRAYLFNGIKYYHSLPDLSVYREKHFHYEEIPKMDNVCFEGYFQSWKFFDEYRDELIKAFGFAWRHKKDLCSVHVRRDDYVQQPEYHPPVTKEYLYAAMVEVAYKQPEIIFRVFSDDIPWCKETFSLPGFDDFKIEYSEGFHEIEELEKMSCCSHQICANSAYSWWAAYLNRNPDKMVVFPRIWFGPALSGHDTKDLYLPNSIIL